MQLSIDIADDKFSEGDNRKNRAKILSVFSTSMDLTKANYLISGAKKTFNLLRHAFIQMLIVQYFDLEWYIWIETNMSGYAIGEVICQLTLENLC